MGGLFQSAGLQQLLATVLGGLKDEPTQDENADTSDESPETPAATPNLATTGNWSEAIPTGGTSASPSLNPNIPAILNQPLVVPKRRPIDYLLMAASPAVSGLTQALLARRHRGRAFAAGLLQGGFNTAVSEAERPEAIRQAQRQRDIANILLQKQVRGTPVAGQNAQGQPEYRFPGTNEVATPGFGPLPRVPRVPKIVNKRDAEGNEVPYEVDDKGQAAPITENQGGVQVPLVSRGKPREAARGIHEAKDGKVYFIEAGKDPVWSGLVGRLPEGERESDKKRQERQDVNQSAVKFLQDARTRLGDKAKPEDITNEALNRFQEATKANPKFGEYADEVTGVIRNVGKRVRGQDELAALIAAMLSGTTAGSQPSK